ncbi:MULTISPECIES: hypothetical protein [Bacillus]|uniref:hypothetical protein n=1 Tax=Bacillus TaxID=1386 RepID=UPI0002410E1B|nr:MULTISPECIES: hypothetical protein [Bacillus cereus group]EHL75600.1 hypothetical protein HMPREF1014_01635 [Bacillus sp. 7_6_55CFAA_CT2]MDA1964192.1 hypothetical protein [Bacillus cereus]MEC3333550.1 hypothetical protein [Bacillus cereus]HDR7759043.1 hypothetical protein [Bacillus cereus]
MQELEINKQGLFLKIDKEQESVLMRSQEISIRKHKLGDASIFEKHANSMQDFIQFFG